MQKKLDELTTYRCDAAASKMAMAQMAMEIAKRALAEATGNFQKAMVEAGLSPEQAVATQPGPGFGTVLDGRTGKPWEFE